MTQSITLPETPTPQPPMPPVTTPQPSVQPSPQAPVPGVPAPEPSVQPPPHMPEPNKSPITGSYQTNAQKQAEADKAASTSKN